MPKMNQQPTANGSEGEGWIAGGCPEFLLKEAEQIRRMYYDSIKEIGLLEKLAIGGTGGIWTWWLADCGKPLYVLWVLLLFQLSLGARAWSIYSVMKKTREYLCKLEILAPIPNGLGWGHDITARSQWFRTFTGFALWAILAVTTLAGMWYFRDITC